MGWFLTKKKKCRSRSAKATWRHRASQWVRDGVFANWRFEHTLTAVKGCVAVLAIVAVFCGWWFAREYLTQYVADARATPVHADQVVIEDAPSWMSPGLAGELRERTAAAFIADGDMASNPLSRKGVDRAHEMLAGNPWVENLTSVRRHGDGRLFVRASYRRPVAVVQAGQGYHLIDRESVRLPGLYLPHQAQRLKTPMIEGVAQPPAPPGQAWPGDDLKDGLLLAQCLSGEPYTGQIEAIDVSHRDARGRTRIVLRTRDGMVRWGLPPKQEQMIEPHWTTKRSRLAKVYERYGNIDAGGRVVDLFGARVFVYQTRDAAFDPNSD